MAAPLTASLAAALASASLACELCGCIVGRAGGLLRLGTLRTGVLVYSEDVDVKMSSGGSWGDGLAVQGSGWRSGNRHILQAMRFFS
jgi:hypothetical protein